MSTLLGTLPRVVGKVAHLKCLEDQIERDIERVCEMSLVIVSTCEKDEFRE